MRIAGRAGDFDALHLLRVAHLLQRIAMIRVARGAEFLELIKSKTCPSDKSH